MAAEITGSMKAEINFDPKSYPGDMAMVQAWHDLTAFVKAHPVLMHAQYDIDVYLGGSGGD